MKYALITGGAIRIGRRITELLNSNGYAVIVHYNSSEIEALELKNRLDCQLIKANFESAQDIKKVIDYCKHIDLVVNNASIFIKDSPLEIKSLKAKHLQVNYTSPKKLIEGLVKYNSKLKVINILDAWAETKPEGFKAYYQSKIMLNKLIKTAKLNFKDIDIYGIKIGATLIKETQREDIFNKVATNHFTPINELLLTIRKILSNNYQSGSVINISRKLNF